MIKAERMELEGPSWDESAEAGNIWHAKTRSLEAGPIESV
jgi:hypothetical protein